MPENINNDRNIHVALVTGIGKRSVLTSSYYSPHFICFPEHNTKNSRTSILLAIVLIYIWVLYYAYLHNITKQTC